MKKYFIKDFVYTHTYNDETIIANKVTGVWLKIPKICYEIIEIISDKYECIENGISYFERDEDKIYFEKIIDKLEIIGVLSEYRYDKLYFRKAEIITISLTNRCNLYCGYCCTNANNSYKDLSKDDIKIIVQNIKLFNPKKIVITGGEPMIREDFFDIISFIREDYSGEIQLLTNGTYITQENVNILKKVNSISISIDGYNKHMVDDIRGNGTFEKVMQSIEILKAINFEKIALSMVFGESNIDDINKFMDFCKMKNVRSVCRFFSRFGRGKSLDTYIKNQEISFLPLALINKDEYIEKTINCNPGNLQLFVNYDGMVYPCQNLISNNFIMFNALNLDDKEVEKIKNRDHRVFKELDKINTALIDRCVDCKHKLFCGYCFANMYNMFSNKFVLESTCELIRNVELDI